MYNSGAGELGWGGGGSGPVDIARGAVSRRHVPFARAALPVNALVELLADGDASVREAVAANPVLPVAVMRQLVSV
ncbi:hypothetical protein ACIQKE_23810 [Streptomyces griseoviridis]